MYRPYQPISNEIGVVALKNGLNLKICIEDLKMGCRQEIIHFMVEHFYQEEPLAVASGVYNNKKALGEMHQFLATNLSSMRVVSYYDLNCADLVAVSLMRLVSKKSRHLDNSWFSTKQCKKYFQLEGDMESHFDVFSALGVDSYYADFGVAVNPEYRGLGMATHMLSFRSWIFEQEGVPLTCAWMTSLGTQIAGEKSGYRTVCQVPYEELAQRHQVILKEIPPFAKLMVRWTNPSNERHFIS